MNVRRHPKGVWVLAIALLAVACGGGADGSAAGVDQTPVAPITDSGTNTDSAADAVSTPDADPTADSDGHAPGHDEHDGNGDPDGPDTHRQDAAADPDDNSDLSVTEATIAAMEAMDPERLAELHAHEDHEGHDDEPREGLNSVEPSRIVIPSIGVDADIGRAGVDGNGEMEVPEDFADTSWFTPSVKPGRIGPSVITGHVDSRQGPAVFFDLKELETGDEIEVHGEGGDVVVFAVTAVEQHPKSDYPRDKVHAATEGPELRLITCGGIFDRSIGHYDDNIIVFAERV